MNPMEEKRQQIAQLEEQRFNLLKTISALKEELKQEAENIVGKCFRDGDDLFVVADCRVNGDKANYMCTRVMPNIECAEGIIQCCATETELFELKEISLEDAKDLFWKNCNTFADTLFGGK